MYISRIIIRNYRNLKNVNLEIDSGTTCIVGENNSGKSNLVSAVRLAIDGNIGAQNRILSPSDFTIGIDPKQPNQILVSLEFADYAGKEYEEAMVASWAISKNRARITYRFRPKRNVIELIQEGNRSNDNLTIDDYRWEIVGAGSNVDPNSVGYEIDFGKSVRFEELQQFLVVSLPPIRDVEQSLRSTRYSPLTRLLNGAGITEDEKNDLIAIMDNANDQIGKSNSIKTVGDKINKSFSKAAGSTFALQVDLGMSSPSFKDITRNLVVLLSNKSIKKMDPSLNGLGLNNVLYVSMLLRYFEERATEGKTPGQLLIFEEPEAHLHPQLQRVLFNAVVKMPFQTLITTHSSHITSKTDLKSVVVLTDDGTPNTASSVPARSSHFTPEEIADLERYLDATRGTLLYARKVILVEGPAELFLIPLLIKSIRNIDLEENGITVIPIFGVHFRSYAKLFGPDTITKKCAIVADGDLEPSDATTIPDDEEQDDDISGFGQDTLSEIENDFVKVFRCDTTFEKEITCKENSQMLYETCNEIGAKRVAERLSKLLSTGSNLKSIEMAKKLVLSTAKRIGKARFAQVCSKHVNGAKALPNYIKEALEWLI